jgi:hypothetical protein
MAETGERAQMTQMEAPGTMDLPEKPRYGSLTVSDGLLLNFDMDDTWIAIKAAWADECDCVMVGLSEIDPLIEKLQEAKTLLEKNVANL